MIYGASGSIGTYAVQLAKSFGADVTGVCGTANLEMVRSLGADRVIDYTQQDFTEGDKTYDVVFDAVGKLSPSRAKKPLRKTGACFNVNRDSGSGGGSPEDLVFVKELIETGKVRAVIDRCYPLEEWSRPTPTLRRDTRRTRGCYRGVASFIDGSADKCSKPVG